MAVYPYALTLANPGFELGNTSGWTTLVGNALVALTGDPHSGTYYARTGSQVRVRSGQVVDLPSDVLADVDAGLLEITAAWWQSQFSDNDEGGVDYEFYDDVGGAGNCIGFNGVPLLDSSTHPIWTERTSSSWVPVGTRSVRLAVRSRRNTGTNNDTYVDDFSLTLDLLGFEQYTLAYNRGDIDTGWTGTGTLTGQNFASGFYGNVPVAVGTSQATIDLYRDYAISSDDYDAIDTGTATAEFTCLNTRFSASENDTGRVWFEALDAGLSSLGDIVETASAVDIGSTEGVAIRDVGTIPANTRTIRYHFLVNRVSGSNADYYASFVSLKIGLPISGLIDIDYDFDYAVELGVSYEFDYTIEQPVVSVDYDFDYAINIGIDYSFEYSIDLGIDYSFNYAIEQTVITIDYDFDYAVQMGVDYQFDYLFDIGQSYSFDYLLRPLEISYDFDFKILIDVWVVVDEWVPTTSENGWNATNFRMRISSSAIGISGKRIRLTMQTSLTEGLDVGSLYVGIAGSGSSFASTPTRLELFGNNSFTLLDDEDYITDPIDFDYTVGQDLIISFYVWNAPLNDTIVLIDELPGWSLYYDDATSTDISGDLDLVSPFLWTDYDAAFITRIEFVAADVITIDYEFDYIVELGVSFDFSYTIADLIVNYSFNFSIINDLTQSRHVTVTIPDVPVKEVWQFLTSVSISDNGKEQRSALREHPRYGINFNYTILDETDRRTRYRELIRYSKMFVVVPLYQYAVNFSASSGNDTFDVNIARTDIRAGDTVYVMTPNADRGTDYVVDTVIGDTITLTSPLAESYENNSWIMPTLEGIVPDGASINMNALGGSALIALDCTTLRPVIRPSAAPDIVPVYDGLPVLDKRPLANSLVDEDFSVSLVLLDLAPDVPVQKFETWTTPKVTGRREYLEPRGPVDYWREFAASVSGKRKPFLLPTFRKDLEPVAPIVGNDITVSGDLYLYLHQFSSFTRLQIETTTGVYWRKALSAVVLSGNTVITLDETVTGTINVISFLNVARLDDDRITLSHNHMDILISLSIGVVNE